MGKELVIIPFAMPEGNFFLFGLINWLINISSVAVGVILFTLILKAITLPFDIMSRISMRKNAIKMEEMRPELEKLQNQYANDKALYNQKMMALYKKTGYSVFGACLPTILTLVIFIVAITGFTNFSKYQNKLYFYNMSVSYNNVLYSGMDVDGEYIIKQNDGDYKLVFDTENQTKIFNIAGEEGFATKALKTEDGRDFNLYAGKFDTTSENPYLVVYTSNSYISYTVYYKINGETVEFRNYGYYVRPENIDNLKNENNPLAKESENFSLIGFNKVIENEVEKEVEGRFTGTTVEEAESFLRSICEKKSADTYSKLDIKFLWVKNIWVADSPLSHPVADSWNKTTASSCSCIGGNNSFVSQFGWDTNNESTSQLKGEDGEKYYNSLTSRLSLEKTAPNGYFILAILTAATSFLMQFVLSKGQKAQMELQSVDGQGAQTQKVMMWLMPILMAVFAFIYTASFSIYIILNSTLSIITTLAINKIVDKKYKPKTSTENITTRSRIYVPKEEEKPTTKKDKKGKAQEPTNDFINNNNEKKTHIRGRFK